MDNQFYQPGGNPQPGAGQPQAGYAPMGYAGVPQGDPYAGMQPGDPYAAMQPGMQPSPYDTMQQGMPGDPYAAMQPGMQPNPYDTMQQGMPGDPYAAMQPGMQPSPYDTMQQGVPYGGVQQPYADPGAQQQPYSDNGYQRLFSDQPQQGQPNAPQQPAAAAPRGKAFAGAEAPVQPGAKRRMTRSDIALIVVGVAALVLLLLGYLHFTYSPQTAPYGQVTTGSLSAIHSGSVLIVRNEIPYDAEGVNSITYAAAEGSRINRNTVICYVYSTGYSSSAVRQLQEYRDEIRDYQESLIESSTIYDANTERYNSDVMTHAKEVRAIMAGDAGSLPNVETQMTQVVSERQLYFDQKYASDQRFSRMKDDERSQTQRINSWMLPYRSTTDALVSFYSDGYEYAINGSNYTEFEPQQVRAMIDGQKPENAVPSKGRTTIYRMVKDNEWYALFLSDDTEWNPVAGETYELQLERFGDTPVTATVVSFTKSGGELLVRLKIVGDVDQVMYLRSCDAVLSESMTTLMVNERAIYVQDEMTGVVVMEGNTKSFIPVNVIYVEDGYAYFQTVQQGLLFDGMTVCLFD